MDFADGSIARGFGCIGGMMMPRAGTLTLTLKDGKKTALALGAWSIDIIDATQADVQGADDTRLTLLN